MYSFRDTPVRAKRLVAYHLKDSGSFPEDSVVGAKITLFSLCRTLESYHQFSVFRVALYESKTGGSEYFEQNAVGAY